MPNLLYLSVDRKTKMQTSDKVLAILEPCAETVDIQAGTELVTSLEKTEEAFRLMRPIKEHTPNGLFINPRLIAKLLEKYKFQDEAFVNIEIVNLIGITGTPIPALSISAKNAMGVIAGMQIHDDSARLYDPFEGE